MTKISDLPDTEDMCVYEAPAGWKPKFARDCSDEFLPEDERVSDEERRTVRVGQKFRPDWSAAKSLKQAS